MTKNKISRKFEVMFDDVDFRNIIKPSSIFKYFQETAHSHTDIMDCNYETLKKQNIAWVLSRIRIEINENLKWKDKFIVETWPLEFSRYSAKRDFRLFNDNEICINGCSLWVLMDLEKRKIVSTDKLNINDIEFLKERAIDNYKLLKIRPEGKDKKIYKRKVKAGEIDMNGHLNNTKYIDYIYDAFTYEELKEYNIKALEANFNSEVLENELLEIKIISSKEKVFYTEISKENNEKAFIAKIEYK